MRKAKIRQPSAQARQRKSRRIAEMFGALEAAMGRQHWWPAGSPFEVIVGAYLTQNTAWTNVELAIANLRRASVLSIAGIRETALEELELLVRPAGYFRQKAARLKRFVEHLDARHQGSLEAMFAQPLPLLRAELLGLNGIGPETADSILLYAASREVFPVDTYTRRIFERHGLAQGGSDYEEIRNGVEEALSASPDAEGAQTPEAKAARAESGVAEAQFPALPIKIHPPSATSAMRRSELSRRYNEFHALLVQTGKHFCLKAHPRCDDCPLRALLPPGARPR